MGTAFINFNLERDSSLQSQTISNATLEIGKNVFYSIIDCMKAEYLLDEPMTGKLDAAVGIKYITIDLGDNLKKNGLEFIFIESVKKLKKLVAPQDYPRNYIDIFYSDLDGIIEAYSKLVKN